MQTLEKPLSRQQTMEYTINQFDTARMCVCVCVCVSIIDLLITNSRGLLVSLLPSFPVPRHQ